MAGVQGESLSNNLLDQVFETDNSTARHRAKLVEEEAKELVFALLREDKQQVAKEAADLIYVTAALGAIYGFDLEEVFNRVHENNMMKMKEGTISETGKLQKPRDHPKTNLWFVGGL